MGFKGSEVQILSSPENTRVYGGTVNPIFTPGYHRAPAKTPAKSSPATTFGQPAPVRPQRRPGIISADPEPFPDPRNIDPKTLI
jgi:hypothetical protein